MKQFLRETWELWYWALFCPTKLQRRLNDWAPREHTSPITFFFAATDEANYPNTPTQTTSFRDILFFRWKERVGGKRLIAQFGLLMLLSSLPLWISTGMLGGSRDLALAAAGLIVAIGIGVFCLPLGLLVPALLDAIYLTMPSVVRSGLEHVLAQLSLSKHLGAAACVAAGSLSIVAAATAAFWRARAIGAASATLLGGTWVSLVLTTWLFKGDSGSAAIWTVALVTCLSFSRPANKASPNPTYRFSQSVGATIAIVFALGFGVGLDLKIGNIVTSLAIVVAACVAALGVGGFIAIGAERAKPNSVAATMVGAVASGVLTGASGLVASGFFAGLAMGPTWLRLLAYWVIGYGLAPMRAGPSITDKWLLARPLDHELTPEELPIARGEDGLTVWLLLSIAWCVAFSALHRWASLTAIPMLLVGYYRVFPGYPLLALRCFAQSIRIDGGSRMKSVEWLHTLPPYENELLKLPLPGHDQILSASFRADPATTLAGIHQMQASPASGLEYTFIKALPSIGRASANLGARDRTRLVTDQLRGVQNVVDIVNGEASVTLALFVLVPEFYRVSDIESPDALAVTSANQDIAKLFPALWDIARDVNAALQKDFPFQRERGLERSLVELDRVRDQLSDLRLDTEIASGWRDVLAHWRALLGQAFDEQLVVARSVEIVQPFQSGNPLRADRIHLFKGRKDLASDLVRRILDQSRPTLILHGPRRCGKSSFLLNLSRLLPENLAPVYVDLQSQAITSSEGDFWYGLVRAAARDLRSRGLNLPVPHRPTFQSAPYPALEDWLDAARPLLGACRLLFCVDEFEKLGDAITRGALTPALFDELRHLIQHRDELSFIFCGAQTLDELGPKWSSYFINAGPVEMLYLNPVDAHELLTNPDPLFDLRYDPTIVEQVLETTGCQPYLLQLIGEAMVKVANRRQCRQIDQTLLEEALTEALTAGEIYFANIWDETTGVVPDEVSAGRELLRALAHGRGISRLDGLASSALRRLVRYHVVVKDDQYRISVPFVARWVRERKGDAVEPDHLDSSSLEGSKLM